MPKRPDASLKTKAGLYKSKIEASKRYDENVYNIRLRVPEEWREVLKNYIENSEEYSSLNQMICSLIASEVGLDYPIPAKDEVEPED